MKFPNGFGTITHLAGNRRKPWAVRKSIDGKQRYLGFYATYEEAYMFLLTLQRHSSVMYSTLTFEQIYHLDMSERRPNIANVTAKNYDIAFNKCTSLFQVPFIKITPSNLQQVILDLPCNIGYATKRRVRQVMHNVYRYAIKYQIVTTDYSQYIDIGKPSRLTHKEPFTTRQLNRVKAIADDSAHPLSFWAKCVVMLCYCGTRPSEFLHVSKHDVKLHQRYFIVRHSKTVAGQNRLVPVSKKVIPYYEYFMSLPGKTLVSYNAEPISYHYFLRYFKKVMKQVNCKPLPHECRHTCATWLDNKNANKLSIKRILGHSVLDVTDGVYTHKNLQQLKKAIDLL